MTARYVVGNLVDLLSWDNIYLQLRTITALHKKTKVPRFRQIYNVLAHTKIISEIRRRELFSINVWCFTRTSMKNRCLVFSHGRTSKPSDFHHSNRVEKCDVMSA